MNKNQINLTGATILIVDDVPANLNVLYQALEPEGYQILAATNGATALKNAKRTLPDLILLDIVMPQMDGFETCRRLKADSATAEIPVIFITAQSATESLVEGLSLGGVDYIIKPFQHQEVRARVRTHLTIKRLRDELKGANQQIQAKNAQLEETLAALKRTQAELVQSEKLAGLGEIAAGVAHEINNPVNFISASLPLLARNLDTVLRVFDKLDSIYEIATPEQEALLGEVDALAAELDYLAARAAIPKLIDAMREGTTRTSEIVKSLYLFARHQNGGIVPTDLHPGLDATLMLLEHRLKEKITVYKDYGSLPQVRCHAGQINQVVMNLLQNAADAIADKGEVFLTTRHVGDTVEIRVRDTGCGIPDEIRDRIFDPFFTTKPVGKGMGLGLWMCYQIVVDGHGGKIEMESEVGKGTEVVVTLPIQPNGA
jgi:signal transduction histidine kinase